jgi:plasmid replication initiation protein
MSNKSITKHNSLIEASYRLTLDEQRLILACIAQIDSRQALPEKNRFEVTVGEFVDLFGVDPSNAYAQMREATERLAERWIIINGDKAHQARWLYEKKYAHGEGYVAIGFSPTVAPYLSVLHRDFTTYKLGQVAAFKSAHSIRLYELLIRFDDSGIRLITVDQLKDRLDLANQYPQFSKLKQWVIDPAVAEINEKSDLNVDWRPIRKKRVVHTLEFKYTKDEPPAKLPEKLVDKVRKSKKKQLAEPPAPQPADPAMVAREIALMREALGCPRKPPD